ncbi:hypothetical protein BHU72_09985 [Desulfuribacillus stibiiarsenatis]|uniref:Uncharacterized protein n=1 Tax=Desulfuribacillus stibiiarsenatis TaxID=1390249 RepID=A0A1E5L8X4_9FIRM|nr:hypothetical protein [Desulfuribacillus stibiiarsenatis]OEH86581.1 hypothetical protein BHU72_09985 [Desulfuribacillus stibiiarsenatis]
MSEVKITFIYQSEYGDQTFSSIDDVSNQAVKREIIDKIERWSRKVRKAAAEQVLQQQLGLEQAKKFNVTFSDKQK